ncbi:hypothetical protein [Micromonospora sp. AP08]|uniref:hypothetical protein n=1 Tax=Micromonospora sp. AP08 TaxID=2604467 RepID=UPI00165205E9|nr:hypothetical protein [Micromonospora sp. AP08]
MRPGEIVVAAEQVRALIDEQFPEWSDLPIVPQPLNGTDNALFRLGDSLTARLPRARWAVDPVDCRAGRPDRRAGGDRRVGRGDGGGRVAGTAGMAAR